MQREVERCTPAGARLEVCPDGLRLDGRPFAVDRPGRVGHWRWAAISPDGNTILAEWSAECEVPQAFLIDATSGQPRPVTSDTARALGWTTDGRAIVIRPPAGACGAGGDPGTYLVTPAGEATRIATTTRLPRSLEPRTVEEVARAAG
jgi:Tol biopolymer transport system component